MTANEQYVFIAGVASNEQHMVWMLNANITYQVGYAVTTTPQTYIYAMECSDNKLFTGHDGVPGKVGLWTFNGQGCSEVSTVNLPSEDPSGDHSSCDNARSL